MRWLTRFALAAALLASVAAEGQTTVVPSGVSQLAPGLWFTGGPPRVEDPVLHYYTEPQCNVVGVANETSPAKIVRAASYPAPTRDVFVFNPPRAAGVCNPFLLQSNIAADATHLFWFDNEIVLGTRLVSLPRAANPGDAPTPLAAFASASLGSPGNEIVASGTSLFVLVHTFSDDFISQLDKNGNELAFIISRPAGSMSKLQFDGRWVWWLEGTTLRRFDTQTSAVQTIDTGVRAFHSEGDQSQCSPLGCTNQNSVYIAKGNQLLFIDSFALGTPPFPIYTAPANRPGASVRAITRSQDAIFFLEVFPSLFSLENRLFRASFVTPELIHGPITRLASFQNLQTDNQNLIWHDPFPPLPATTGQISSIKNNTPAAFVLQATGLEVTQGIQNLSHDVMLIENKRTIVRLYVRSGDSRTVSGVSATLSGSTQLAGSLGTLEPINPAGKLVDVLPSATRGQFTRSFQFELPLAWTRQGPLNLAATVNPFGKVFENDTSDNAVFAGPFPFEPSPRLHVHYLNIAYFLDGALYVPADADVAASQRYMRRMYPIGAPLFGFAGPGLHITQSTLVIPDLELHVKRTHPDCVKNYPADPDPAKDQSGNRNKCASDVVHALMAEEIRLGAIPAGQRTYANIPQAPDPPPQPSMPAISYFTRGYGGGAKGSGPSGPEGSETFRNYATHEIGHTLGRAHPGTTISAATCGHSLDDGAYPYPRAQIGKADSAAKQLAYFDIPEAGVPLAVWDPAFAFDTMGYCAPYRISDYTFEGIYQFLGPASAAAASGRGPAAPSGGAPVAGDWLFATGRLDASSGTGDILRARRVPEVTDATPPDPAGVNALEQRDAGGNLLASTPFSAMPIDESPGTSSWDLVVPFEPGTAELRLLDGTGTVVAARSVSANAPAVSDVLLPGAPDPLDGVVTVSWLASDADGDPLTFDLLASVDGGVTFRKIVSGVDTTSHDLDSTLLAGGATVLRVRASDGLLTGFADSAPLVVAPRPPQARIASPQDGDTADWGQLVTLEGEAIDLQDPFVPDGNFVWTNAYGVIGTGRNLQTAALQVGVNPITLTVTNSLGLSATDVIDVVIGDRLADPAPSLASTPQSLAWHVADSETSPQFATLLIENAGGGTLSFDIASDQPWLTLDGQTALSSVTPPASFTIAADTASAPQGLTQSALITVQNSASPADALVIPVALSKGNVFDQVVLADADGDLVPDSADNCPFIANADQSDLGGVGAGASPDGIGDMCQCGDVSGNGRVTTADATLIKRSLLVPPTAALARPDLCNVGGSSACTTADATITTRALLAPPTASVQQACAPALP